MGYLRRMFGRDTNESAEEYMRRLNTEDMGRGGYVKAIVPSIVELYDRVAALEARLDVGDRR
jgi:hypothetical protein